MQEKEAYLESEITFRVRYCETDQMGIAHHPVYFIWFENGRIDLLKKSGIDYAEMERNGEYLPVVTCASKYFRPTRFDDMIVVKTVFVEVEANRIGFGAWIDKQEEDSQDRTPIAKLYSLHAYAKEDMVARPLPDDVFDSTFSKKYDGTFFSRKRRRRPPGF